MSKHTPGPWAAGIPQKESVVGYHCCPVQVGPAGREGNVIAMIYMGGDGAMSGDVASVEANARLIAAAPDMLEALKGARAAFIVEYDIEGGAQSVSYNGDALRPLIRLLDAAIAKAEGQS